MEKTKMKKWEWFQSINYSYRNTFTWAFRRTICGNIWSFRRNKISLFKCYENNFCKLCFCWCKYCLSRNLSSSRKRYRILSCINFPSAYISLACCMDIRRNYQKFKYKHRPCLVYIFNRWGSLNRNSLYIYETNL